MSYSAFVTALAAEMVVETDDADFVAILPTIIDYAEGRCYRDLGLADACVTTSGTLTADQRSFTLPTGNGHVLVVDYINVIDGSSVIHTVSPASRASIDAFYPSDTANAATDIPELFARIDDTTVLLGPSPGDTWACKVIHTIRPTALSAVNTTTFLSEYLPELFLAAAMVSAAGYQKNYGAMAEDPKMAQSWEQQYQTLLSGARDEELAKRYATSLSSVGRG